MSDFNLSLSVTRGEIAYALADTPEQLVYVLSSISARVDIDELVEYASTTDRDAGDVAAFYRKFADAVSSKETNHV